MLNGIGTQNSTNVFIMADVKQILLQEVALMSRHKVVDGV